MGRKRNLAIFVFIVILSQLEHGIRTCQPHFCGDDRQHVEFMKIVFFVIAAASIAAAVYVGLWLFEGLMDLVGLPGTIVIAILYVLWF